MTLKDCRQGARARVAGVHTSEALGARLRALGLFCGAEVSVLRVSPRRRVWLVETAFSTFALGAEIAESVEVTA